MSVSDSEDRSQAEGGEESAGSTFGEVGAVDRQLRQQEQSRRSDPIPDSRDQTDADPRREQREREPAETRSRPERQEGEPRLGRAMPEYALDVSVLK